ncbi:MAG: peptidoglycan-binding protein [Clostridia bacterium]|nr:peptidoglycan-binding protein [Clostridia bacterium]
MYRVYDKEEAIRQVQIYLSKALDANIFVAPTGVYDENTRLAVIAFQKQIGINPSGVVDYETFTLLYERYRINNDISDLNETVGSFIKFPLYPGQFNSALVSINRTLAGILDYYGHTHSIRESNFYSDQTSKAVKILRGIYLLSDEDFIDEIFYLKMISDQDSINRVNNFT